MTDIAAPLHSPHLASAKPDLKAPSNPLALILFFGILAAGVLYTAYSLYVDVEDSGMKATTYLPFLLLFVALLIALGFEFVNGCRWNDRGRRRVRASGFDHPRIVVGRRRHHGGQWLRPAMGHGAQPAVGLGPHAARGHHAFGVPLRTLRQSALRCPRRFRAITPGNASTA